MTGSRHYFRNLAKFGIGVGAVLLAKSFAVNAQEIKPDSAAALAAWDRIVGVLGHPRCLNCHQDRIPLQGDMRRVHIPLVVRGPDNHGVGPMRCGNCHNGSGNNETSGTPGAGGSGVWQLAPPSMLWQGLSSGDLCRSLRDTARNGGRDGTALVTHVDDEPLVLWGWNPGGDRTAVPMPHDEFVDQVKTWVAGSMACPG